MLDIFLVFFLGLTPPILSLWLMRKTERHEQPIVSVIDIAAAQRTRSLRESQEPILPPEHHYIEGIGLLIGDVSCRFNARSAYLRCAVNPEGPCKGCSHYEAIDDNDLKF